MRQIHRLTRIRSSVWNTFATEYMSQGCRMTWRSGYRKTWCRVTHIVCTDSVCWSSWQKLRSMAHWTVLSFILPEDSVCWDLFVRQMWHPNTCDPPVRSISRCLSILFISSLDWLRLLAAPSFTWWLISVRLCLVCLCICTSVSWTTCVPFHPFFSSRCVHVNGVRVL